MIDKSSNEDNYIYTKLKWDTEFFGVQCGKAILNDVLTQENWQCLQKLWSSNDFVSITNMNSNSVNAVQIGMRTKAFLIDVNIQFAKKLSSNYNVDGHINIQDNFDFDQEILYLANFKYSKFILDKNLNELGGDKVYKKWMSNAFNKKGKFYIVYKEDVRYGGFALFHIEDATLVIELISVDESMIGRGIGTMIFQAIEDYGYKHNCTRLEVGTQVRNIEAINFYNKMGCRQIACHETYHLWL